MNKTEQKIKQAFESATPEVLDRVLSQCPETKSKVTPMKKKANFRPLLNFAATVAIIVTLFGVGMLAAILVSPEAGPSYTDPNLNHFAQPGENTDPDEVVPTDTAPYNTEPFYTEPQNTSSTEDYPVPPEVLITAEEATDIAKEKFLEIAGDNGEAYEVSILTDENEDGTAYYIVTITRGTDYFVSKIDSVKGPAYSSHWNTDKMESPLDYVSAEDAINAAIKAADCDPNAVTNVVAALENGVFSQEWVVHFCCKGEKAICHVDGYTGEVLRIQWKEGDIISKGYIGQGEARMVALRSAGVESQFGTVRATVKLYEDTNPFYIVNFVWNNQEYSIRVDAVTGAIWETLINQAAISAAEAEEIALTAAGLWEQYKDRPEDVHSKYFAYAPDPFYYVCFQVDVGDYGCTYAYLVHAGTGEIMFFHHQEPGKPEYLLSLEYAIQRCEELLGGTATEIQYAKIVLDAHSPYYHITMVVNELTYDFEFDLLTHKINQLNCHKSYRPD